MPTYTALSDRQTVIAAVQPASQAVGTVPLGYVDMKLWTGVQFVVNVGAGGGTISAVVQQATSVTGAGAKSLAVTKAFPANATAGVYVVNVRGTDIDCNNGYEFVTLSVTVAGSATFLDVIVLGDPEATPPSAINGAIAVVAVQ